MNHFSYQIYEMAHSAMAPARALSDATRKVLNNPFNPFANTPVAKNIAASAEMFERMTRRYGKPKFDLGSTLLNEGRVNIIEEVVWSKPFCNVIRFRRENARPLNQPKFLIVAPMSGHYATLLRGTVEAFLPYYDVYITDWLDARHVPLFVGKFDLDDYIDYLIEICETLGEGLHTLGVCQPSVPLMAAVARMNAENNPFVPASMTIMGGPIDTRKSPTEVNKLAESRGSQWFRDNCIHTVPFFNAGCGRQVYPGFLQLSGFMAMNMDKHVNAHVSMFKHLVKGDGDSAEKHREFYDEYMAVMDLTAEYYLQTIDNVFVNHTMPKGEFKHRGVLIDLKAINKTALMTVEGENDDISGIGQTQAAHDLCSNIPAHLKVDYLQKDVGHYGVFNGSRFRSMIAPRIRDFISNSEAEIHKAKAKPALRIAAE